MSEAQPEAVESVPDGGGGAADAADDRQDPTITETERAFMEEVRAEIPADMAAGPLANIMSNPSRLVKFCRARTLDLKKTVKMLEHTAEFRTERESATILTRFKPNEDFRTVLLFPIHYLRDKDGGLVLIHRTGHFHGSYFCKYYSEPYLLDLVQHCLEHMTQDAMRHMRETGAAPYVTFVLDLSGYSSHVLGPMGITQKLINVFQNHFPETLKRAYLLNTPWVFRAVWAVVQAFLDPVVKAKIHMLVRGGGANRATGAVCSASSSSRSRSSVAVGGGGGGLFGSGVLRVVREPSACGHPSAPCAGTLARSRRCSCSLCRMSVALWLCLPSRPWHVM
jgi:hypothetical protein